MKSVTKILKPQIFLTVLAALYVSCRDSGPSENERNQDSRENIRDSVLILGAPLNLVTEEIEIQTEEVIDSVINLEEDESTEEVADIMPEPQGEERDIQYMPQDLNENKKDKSFHKNMGKKKRPFKSNRNFNHSRVGDSVCNVEGDKTIETIQITREGNKTNKRGRTTSSINSISKVIEWSKSGEAIPCDSLSKRIDMEKAEMEGVTKQVTLTKIKSRTTSHTKGDTTTERHRESKVTGSRTIIFGEISPPAEGVFTVNKTIEYNLTVESTNTDIDGQSTATSRTINTLTPLQIEVKKKLNNNWRKGKKRGHWLERKIVSGSTLSTRDGYSLTLTFDNATFINDRGCTPKSGEITVTMEKNDLKETFTVELANSEAILNIADKVRNQELILDSCKSMK